MSKPIAWTPELQEELNSKDKSDFVREVENNRAVAEKMWRELQDDQKQILLDVMLKTQIVQNLDDGYGKVIVTIQQKRIHSVKMLQEKLAKPLDAELPAEHVRK